MRTLFFGIVVALFFCSTVSAQTNIRFGVTANPGLSWYTPDNSDIEKDGVRFNFTYGLIMDMPFGTNERYAFNTGLQINMAGGRLLGSDTMGNSSLVAKVQYLEIPISIKLRSNAVNDMIFYGQMGIVPGFPFRKRANYTNGALAGTNEKLENIPFDPNDIEKVVPFHLGMLIEAGMEYALSENTYLVAGIYFNNGFTNTIKDNDEQRIVMRTVGLRIGVLF